MATMGQELIKIFKLYIKQVSKYEKSNKDADSIVNFKELKALIEQTPIYNRRDYTFWLEELSHIIETNSCHHEQVEEIDSMTQKCKTCGYVRNAYYVDDEFGKFNWSNAQKEWYKWHRKSDTKSWNHS